MDTHKICIKCQVNKAITEFYLRTGTNRPRGECKACWTARNNKANKDYRIAYYRADRKNDPEKYRRQTAQRKLAYPNKILLRAAKYRAKLKGLEFNIALEDIVIPSICPVLGIEIKAVKGNGPDDSSPSLDRIDNNLGYIKGNVRVISFRANSLRKDGTLQEFMAIVEDMKKNIHKLVDKSG